MTMQYKVKEFDPAIHEKWVALTLRQPDADYVSREVLQRSNGDWIACKSGLSFKFTTDYRGDILICSAPGKESSVHPTGVTCGLVELISIEEISDGEFLWTFRNPRRVIPYPARGKAGRLWTYVCPKGEVTEYPRLVKLGE